MEGKRIAADEAEKCRIAAAWYGAAFARQRKLPELETLLRDPEERGEQTPDDMLGVMLAIQAAGGDVTIEIVDATEFE